MDKEFEFQTKKVSLRTRSPADELFFKGKLLPLNLLPRVQMVEKLLQNNVDSTPDDNARSQSSLPLEGNISPSESRKTKKLWAWLAQRLISSKTYIKSLFNKYGCSNKSCGASEETKLPGSSARTSTRG